MDRLNLIQMMKLLQNCESMEETLEKIKKLKPY